MPEHAVKCWIRRRGDGPAHSVNYSAMRLDYVDAVDTPAIAVPLGLAERLLSVVADMEVTDEERDQLERLCREMRKEVGS